MVKNLSIPTSTLKKIHHVICYHWFRGAQVEEIIRLGWIEGTIKFADYLKETTIFIPKIQGIISKIFNKSAVVVTFSGG